MKTHYVAAFALVASLAGGGAGFSQTRAPATFNIYASVPMSDPGYIAKGEAVRVKLMRCGMGVESDETRNFAGLAEGLFIVLSGPHRSAEDARAALAKAKACGVEGYSRQTRRIYGD